MTIKQYAIPTADFGNVIELTAAQGVAVAPTLIGSYRMIAGELATATLTVSAPAISSTNPADNATNVSVSSNIIATFTKPIVFVTGNIVLRVNIASVWSDLEVFDVATEQGTGPGQVSISGAVLTINPTLSLSSALEYAVRIASTAIDDLGGNGYAGIADDTTWSFTSETVSSLTPPTWQAAGTADATNGTPTAANPAHATNDILVVYNAARAVDAISTALDSEGWTAMTAYDPSSSSTEVRLKTWYKRAASGAEANPTMNDCGGISLAAVGNIRGCKTSGDPWVAIGSPQQGSGTAATSPGGTTTGDERLIMHVVHVLYDSATSQLVSFVNGDLTDVQIRYQYQDQDGFGMGIYVITGIKAVAGTFGDAALTLANSAPWSSASYAFIPVGG